MPELHPSVSALGSHLDEEFAESAPQNFWKRVERKIDSLTSFTPSEPPMTEDDKRVEEAMHLDQ